MNDEPDRTEDKRKKLLIGVVGVCAAGKSTLIAGLEARGYRGRHIAQEHSYVKDMWKRITNPDVLIFLDASYPVTVERNKLNWNEADWQEQQRRLIHAREHADFYIQTDAHSSDQVLEEVVSFIEFFLANEHFPTPRT
jgi:guanylate kinase